MPEWMISGGVGGFLVLWGSWMLASHRRAWAAEQARHADPNVEGTDVEGTDVEGTDAGNETERSGELEFYRRRHRRRVQTTCLVILVGVMIPVGDLLVFKAPLQPPWNALLSTAYWGVVLLLLVWIVLQAVGDMLSTQVRARNELAKIRVRQRQLELEVERIRAAHRDVHHTTDD